MISIYGSARSSAARCVWLLEELGVPYEIKPLDFQKKEHKNPDYLKLNPNGKVPTMVDGDFVLWESLAINTYLAAKYRPALLGKNLEERGQIDQWSLWSIIHLYAAFYPLVMQKWQKTPDSEQTATAKAALPGWLAILDAHLLGRSAMVGTEFTLADLTVMSVVRSAAFIEYPLNDWPNLVAWMDMINQRPALQKMSTL